MKGYAVIEDCIVDGEEHLTKRFFANPKHAEIVMRQLIYRNRGFCVSQTRWRLRCADWLLEALMIVLGG